VKVNLVCAGIVKTDLWRSMSETERNTLFENAGQSLPVGRVGEPEGIAEAYLYFMRERFSTGAMLVGDGEAFWFKRQPLCRGRRTFPPRP
jgi:NAD(P)-dependent dehydrogenase (short-subunit alcohol dehydrogenase family)